MSELEHMHERDRIIDAIVEAVTTQLKDAIEEIKDELQLPGPEELVSEWIRQLTPRRPPTGAHG